MKSILIASIALAFTATAAHAEPAIKIKTGDIQPIPYSIDGGGDLENVFSSNVISFNVVAHPGSSANGTIFVKAMIPGRCTDLFLTTQKAYQKHRVCSVE